MPGDARYRILLGLVIAGLVVVRSYHHAQSLRAGPVQRFESPLNMTLRAIAGFAGLALLIVYLAKPEWLAWAAIPLRPWLRWAGFVLGIASLALLAWVHHELGRNFSGTLHLRAEHTLVTSGPYRWARHPMYTAFYGLGLAFLLVPANWLLGGIVLLSVTAVMISRVNKEDALMAERFGQQYRAWAAHTGRFLPRLRT